MSDMTPDSQQQCSPSSGVQISMHTLEPNERLELPDCEHAVLVTEGLLYVVLDDDEAALIPGEEIVIRRGRLQFAWNAGSDVARVAALRR